ncbi:hypothetical protein FHR87_000950 [Azomonas macrocytogenes]|uniref:Uncharacterized protein n=1 Tax=Azomonas macrocytogenes TaxID=69962 RepID=A0A839SZ00_AZOMA|nr:hypothetical protein [Azomonas macrocytogenes]MBB3102567.1 hypothetical protein [Azomonas macrocytogenes]
MTFITRVSVSGTEKAIPNLLELVAVITHQLNNAAKVFSRETDIPGHAAVMQPDFRSTSRVINMHVSRFTLFVAVEVDAETVFEQKRWYRFTHLTLEVDATRGVARRTPDLYALAIVNLIDASQQNDVVDQIAGDFVQMQMQMSTCLLFDFGTGSRIRHIPSFSHLQILQDLQLFLDCVGVPVSYLGRCSQAAFACLAGWCASVHTWVFGHFMCPWMVRHLRVST